MSTIRPARLADLPQLSQLFDLYRQFYRQPPDLALAQQFLHSRLAEASSHIFVAEQGGRLLGFTQLYPLFCSVAARPYYLLYDLYVGADARGQGLGEALLRRAAQFGAEQGADRLELATALDNATAQRLYQRLGWQRDNDFYHYSLPLA